ncbi:MAG: peptidylprolyl isomerase [Bacteroidetes bacterium]|nr:MAG: peptidylprolyl isomerase [Bacteroidota bacterium]
MKKYISISLYVLLALGISMSSHAQKSTKDGDVLVTITTELGIITVKLYDKTPLHKANFLKLAESGEMNGSIFHRVINNFMIQGGGAPGTNGSQSIGSTIPAEFIPDYFHKKGALCAARMGDQVNPKKESSGSQFYIVHGRVSSNADLDVMEKRSRTKYTEAQRRAYTTVGGTPHLDGGYTVFGEVVEGMEVVDKIAVVAVNGSVPATAITIQLKVVK